MNSIENIRIVVKIPHLYLQTGPITSFHEDMKIGKWKIPYRITVVLCMLLPSGWLTPLLVSENSEIRNSCGNGYRVEFQAKIYSNIFTKVNTFCVISD